MSDGVYRWRTGGSADVLECDSVFERAQRVLDDEVVDGVLRFGGGEVLSDGISGEVWASLSPRSWQAIHVWSLDSCSP